MDDYLKLDHRDFNLNSPIRSELFLLTVNENNFHCLFLVTNYVILHVLKFRKLVNLATKITRTTLLKMSVIKFTDL